MPKISANSLCRDCMFNVQQCVCEKWIFFIENTVGWTSCHTIESYMIAFVRRHRVLPKSFCKNEKNILCVDFLDVAISEIAAIQKKSGNELEAKFKDHLQLLVDGQNLFMESCHRLQLNERQIENDMVFILERILDHVDNRWDQSGCILYFLTTILPVSVVITYTCILSKLNTPSVGALLT